MARFETHWKTVLRGAIIAVFLPLLAPCQQQPAPAAATAQIDELLKQANEQMNVKGQFERAAEFAQQALDLSQKLGDKVRASSALTFLGAAYSYQGRLAEALEVAQRNLGVARESGDKKALEQALNNMAAMLGGLGRYEECLSYFYQLLDVARETKDQTMEYMALLNIGEAYVVSGDPDKAQAPLEDSLRIARQIKHDSLVSNPSKKATEMALLNLGSMENARQHYRAALNYYEQVHLSRPESPLWAASALSGMAEAHQQLGEPQKAIALFQESMSLAEKSSNRLGVAKTLSQIGVNQETLGRLNEALESQTRALAQIRQSGSPIDEWQCESQMAHVLRAMGRKEDALEHYQTAIRGIERLRTSALNTDEGRAGVLAASRATYAQTADLLYDLHRQEEALATAERGRARAFLDMLAESRVGVINELNPDQRKREDAILARISAAQREPWKTNSTAEKKKKIESELHSAEQDLEALHLEVRRSNPRYASVQYPEPVSAGEIRSKLLADRTALVEYLLGEKRSLVWVVTKTTLATAVLPARKDIEEQVAAYRKLLSGRASTLTMRQSTEEIRRLGVKLYGSVFQPIAGAVAGCGTLVIVPDGSLDYLPFEALVAASGKAPDSQPTYLAEKFATVYGPSASALAIVQELNHEVDSPPKDLLAFGDPVPMSSAAGFTAANQATGLARGTRQVLATEDYAERGFSLARLPYTRDEVLAISRLFPAGRRRVYLGPEAQEETVKSERLEQFRYIHFATHGFLDEVKPGRSGLLLSRASQSSEDGILQMGEIMRLRMNADLVTLSACSTGLGKLVNGEGILGITRTFFYAGARNVAVTLWNVNDSATAALMASFYRYLNRGVPKSQALRQAKLALLHDSQPLWRHPYFWAAFVIEGEGR